ncbi:MAG: EscR/YscR/HrcR family type III secretion system export apparatus protein [Bdellovibrionales bacterium]|nr:EscR/YscR/HrcR family type III secretion system export apparatus protein [Bdellovibrionales bacterium]
MFVEGDPAAAIVFAFTIAAIPLALLACTSYLKLSIVFSLLRNALGAQNVPSAALAGMLSLLLSAHIMRPVLVEMADHWEEPAGLKSNHTSTTAWFTEEWFHQWEAVLAPLEAFLVRHSDPRERRFFATLSERTDEAKTKEPSAPACASRGKHEDNCAPPASAQGPGEGLSPYEHEDALTLASAFVVSELREAFAIGFLLWIPFLVVDLVVSHVLIALGMMMVSPIMISLPLKIGLFFLCDGWLLLCNGLVAGYR